MNLLFGRSQQALNQAAAVVKRLSKEDRDYLYLRAQIQLVDGYSGLLRTKPDDLEYERRLQQAIQELERVLRQVE